MMPNLNPRMLKQAMKRMGIKQDSIDATEVIIKTSEGEYVIKDPEVLKVNMMGQETFQVSGNIEFVESKPYTDEDVKIVAEQAGCSEDEARSVLEKTGGDLAEAILQLKK